jgi:hypothetical protein
MPFPDDLLEQAEELAAKDPIHPKQASLRRAVSTAYYALSDLLIDEAVSKWPVERQRSVLARTVEHARIKRVSDDVLTTARAAAVSLLSYIWWQATLFNSRSIG